MTRELIPVIGLDFEGVFPSPGAPMGAVLFGQASQLAGQGGVASVLRSSFRRARYLRAIFLKQT